MEITSEFQSQPEVSSFDKQFKPQKLKLFGGTIQVADVTPESPIPGKTDVPVLFAPGITENPVTNKGPLRILFDQGRHVISLSHMRHGGEVSQSYTSLTERIKSRLSEQSDSVTSTSYLEDMHERWKKIKDLPQASLRRALTLLGVLEEKGIDKVDVIDHSLGGIDAVVAAYLCPDKFRTIVSIETGGMIGKDTPVEIFKRGMQQTKADAHERIDYPATFEETTDERLTAAVEQQTEDVFSRHDGNKSVRRYVLANPKRVINELQALAYTQLPELLQNIRSQGIKVGLIHGVDDITYPMDKIQQMATVDNPLQKGTVDGFLSIKGSHNTFYLDPRITWLADDLLTRLTDRKNTAEEAK